MSWRTSSRAMAASIAAILASAGTANAAALELVIKNTNAVPGIAGAAWAASGPFQPSSIDQFGNVGFRGTLLTGTGGVTASDNSTMWYGAPGGLGLVARTGNQAPGLPAGVNATGFNSQNLPLSPNGKMWFGSATPVPNGYVATGSFGSLTKVARRNDVLPGIALPIVDNPGSSSNYSNVNNAGQTLVFASVTGFTTSGLWVGSGASLQLAYQSGGSYAGLPALTTVRGPQSGYLHNGFGSLLSGILLNNNAGLGISSNNNEFLLTLPFGGSTFGVVAREGDAAPGAGGATYLRGLFDPLFGSDAQSFFLTNGNYNNAGHAIYSSGLEGAGVVGTTNNAALFYYDGTSTNMLRRRGDATTAVAGATFAISSQQAINARLNNNDEVAMTASLTQGVGGVTAASDAVLLRTTLGSASDSLIAREGSAVPITPGALWGTSFGSLMQNNAGQLVFQTTLLDDPSNPNDNVTASNDLALFAWDPVDGYILVAREGESLASIGINLTLTGSWLGLFNTANADGGANALSDNGWLTFRVSGTALPGFTDTSAIVRTQVPAPGTAFGLLVGGIALLRRRTR